MAYGDYIHCAQCAETNGLGHKLIYDGYHSTREILEERFGEDYEILCPMCIASLRSRIAELERERDEAIDKAIRYDLDAAGIAQRESESRELIELRAEVARLRMHLHNIRAACMSDRLFRMFTEQQFWHAHHVDLVWRFDGKDERVEADWLKAIWYELKRAALAREEE